MDDRVVRSNDRPFPDETVLQPLVIALFVEMRHVLHNRTTQGRLPNENQLGQALLIDRAYEALGERIQIRRQWWQADYLRTALLHELPESF